MPCVEKGKAKKLNLVKLGGPLGDLSGMTTAERAEIVQQDGRRRKAGRSGSLQEP